MKHISIKANDSDPLEERIKVIEEKLNVIAITVVVATMIPINKRSSGSLKNDLDLCSIKRR